MQIIPPWALLLIVLGYFLLLIVVGYFTSRGADNEDFFIAGRKSKWYLVAFGMIGASLSGVTLISIPGNVGANGVNQDFSYLQIVFGYLLGYAVIALVLMPIYYRYNLTSIYGYLEQRLGWHAYKTGAAYFLLSRLLGSSLRLYLVAIVLQQFILGPMGVPFWLTTLVTLALIWTYTYKGGIKTIVYTDTLQTVFLLGAVIATILTIGWQLEKNIGDLIGMVYQSEYSQVFFFKGGWADPNNFFKQFFSGALITIVMTGLDQDMMQKNLSCRNIQEAQKNMFTFSGILLFANILFLTMGALLYLYAANIGLDVPERTDQLFPLIAFNHLPAIGAVFFVLGLIAAAYSSADSTLTALTTSFCVDFLNMEKNQRDDAENKRTRMWVHIGFSLIMALLIIVINAVNSDAVINKVFEWAGYTYGPLLGLFVFGIATRRQVSGPLVIAICLATPIISYILNANSAEWFAGFKFGFLIIALNGLLTFLGLLAISKPGETQQSY